MRISALINHTKLTAVTLRSRCVTCNALYLRTWTETGLPNHNMPMLKLRVLEYVCLDVYSIIYASVITETISRY